MHKLSCLAAIPLVLVFTSLAHAQCSQGAGSACVTSFTISPSDIPATAYTPQGQPLSATYRQLLILSCLR